MRGFFLNPATHDLAVQNGRFRTVSDDEATAQEIKTRLLFFKGESFTDRREGVPYWTEILAVKGVDLNRVKAIIRAVIRSVPAVVDVPRLEIVYDRATRRASVDFEARTVRGSTIRSADFGPLLIG